MENYSYHLPVYVVTGGVDSAGHSSELGAGQIGLFDRQTFSVATALGNGKEFFFAQGSIGGKDWYGNPVSESHKSAFFYGKDVENIYLSKPKTVQNEEWVIGFNGSPSSKTLKFEKGKATRVKFYFHGEPTYRFFNGPKEYVVSYTPKEDCTEPCQGSDCPDAITDCLTHTQALIDSINNHVELKKFGVKAAIVVTPYSATAANMEIYELELCDNGDAQALNAVKSQYPTKDVVRSKRVGSKSTYRFCQPTTDAAPANFTQTGSVLQAVCDECPSGSYLVPAKDVWIVKRPIVGGEDFSTEVSRDNYANTIWTAYASQESVTTTSSTTSTTTAAGTGNPDATFIANDGAVAIVKLKFASGVVLDPPIGADIVEFSHTEAAVCVFSTPASTAWTLSADTGIRSKRTLKIKNLNRPDCDADGDRIADLTDVLSGVVGIDIGTLTKIAGTACKDDYTVEQFSQDCLEESCLTNNVTFTYDELPAFENESWEVVPPTVVENSSRKCGIKVSAGYIDPQFGNCSFSPMDYYNSEPVKMEVSLLQEDGSNCDAAEWPTVSQTKVGRIGRQSGEWLIREVVMKQAAYLKHVDQFNESPRMREAFDMNLLGQVDRKANYNLYYVTYKASYGKSYRKNEQEKFTTIFAFKEGDSSILQFTSQVVDVLVAKSGVNVHVID